MRTLGHARVGPRQAGAGLIEILIAVVIISLGFLAAARMQVDSMRTSQGAYYRSQAYFMASAMVDRMRANVLGVSRGHYDAKITSAAASDPDCDANFCDPLGIAQQDIRDWSTDLHAFGRTDFVPLLPSVSPIAGDAGVAARGEIIRTAEGRYTIRLVWGEIVAGQSEASELTLAFVAER